MNPYSLPAVIAFTINFFIALVVLLEKPKEALNQWFFLFVFIFSVWNLSEILILNSALYEKALFGAQILYRALFLAPAIFLVISFLFPKSIKYHNPGYAGRVLIFVLPVLLLALSFPNFKITVQPFEQLPSVYYYQILTHIDTVFILLLLTASGYLLWGTINLVKKLGKAKTIGERNQILFLLIGVITIFVSYLVMNLVRPMLGKYFSYYFLSTILTLAISFFFFAAITQYRILKLSRMLSGSIAYTLISSIVLVVYFLVIKGLSEGLGNLISVNSFFVNALIIFVLILLIMPLVSRVQHIIDRLLYKNIYTYRRKFLAFSNELNKYTDTSRFFKKIKSFLLQNFNIQEVLIFLKDEENQNFALWSNQEVTIPVNGNLAHNLLKAKSAIEYNNIRNEMPDSETPRVFEDADIKILLHIIHGKELSGFIALSGKKDKRFFSQEELEILSIFSNEMAIAFHLNKMIETMQQRERNRARIERLASIGQMTAGIAHEIRNPLNTIATSAETIQRKKLDINTRNELVDYILDETNRLNRILTDFLKLSKIESVKKESIMLDTFLKKISLEIQSRLPENVTFKVEKNNDIQQIFLPADLVYECILNLIINAIQAVKEKNQQHFGYQGKIELKIYKKSKYIYFEVSDNGPGIPAAYREKIYDPFFTTKSEGTGLGLSLSAQIAEAIQGNLKYKTSDYRTIFTLSVPF